MNMSFSGFFRRIVDIPIWIRWMCYIVPLRVSIIYFVVYIYCKCACIRLCVY